MSSLEMSHLDLECGGGHRRSSAARDEEEEGSVCFSEADEGSCYSQFYSTADGSNDDYNIEQLFDSRRVSSVVKTDCWTENKNGVHEIKVHLGKVERDCRICQLSLEMDGSNQENGVPIELGCSCKDDMAAVHKHCAEAWFKIKGNKRSVTAVESESALKRLFEGLGIDKPFRFYRTCEICNSVARNIVGPNDIESAQQASESNAMAANAASAPLSSTTETRTCINGHRFLNFLLACMVFAFVISWLFHFNIPS